MQKVIFAFALALAATSGGRANAQQQEKVPMNWTSLGELASRYCEVYKCAVELPPSAMSYPIIVPFYNSESKIYLEAQLKAFAMERNHYCAISPAKVSCYEKKKSVHIIDSSNARWGVVPVDAEALELHRRVIEHNQGVGAFPSPIDSVSMFGSPAPYRSNYLYVIKVLITITEFDLGYKKVKASYISDFYVSDFFNDYLKYGSTVRELNTSQTAENGTRTDSFNDKLQGLQIADGKLVTITANNRDLQTYLFGGSQELLQVRKECVFSLFGFELFCGLVQTSIIISLE